MNAQRPFPLLWGLSKVPALVAPLVAGSCKGVTALAAIQHKPCLITHFVMLLPSQTAMVRYFVRGNRVCEHHASTTISVTSSNNTSHTSLTTRKTTTEK
jgi:hypothetical protein